MSKRIVFMGTPDFAVPALEMLLTTGQLVGVVTQPDRPAGRGKRLQPPPVKQVAEAAGVPVYQPSTLRPPATAVPIQQWQPDLIIVAAFGQILRPHLLDFPPLGCVNIHASLLPRWRGAAPIQQAILAGDDQTGITLMQMDVGLDTGGMLAQATLPIAPHETAATLHDRLAVLGAELLAETLPDLLARRLTATPQDDAAACYAPMIRKEDGLLAWEESAAALDRRIRALTPWPGAFTYWQGKLLKINEARPWMTLPHETETRPIGQPFQTTDGLFVPTGEGYLQLEQLQLAGKKAVAAADFLRGHPQFGAGDQQLTS